jgi:hypothetical protein
MNVVSAEKATFIHIGFELDENGGYGTYIGKDVKATKKETTLDYIIGKLSADVIYKNFSDHFNKILRSWGGGVNAYATTYGIGVFVAVGFRNGISETKNRIEKELNDMGVNFTTEYSDGGWVFRYKISKSAKNIETIERLTASVAR